MVAKKSLQILELLLEAFVIPKQELQAGLGAFVDGFFAFAAAGDIEFPHRVRIDPMPKIGLGLSVDLIQVDDVQRSEIF